MSVMFPPQIDVVDEATTKQVAEAFRKGLDEGKHQCEILGPRLSKDVIATLRHWGMDGPSNRFGFGSTAKKVAQEQEAALKQAAEHMKSAAYYIDAWHLIMDGKFWTPIDLARKAQEEGKNDPHVLVRRK